MDFDSDAVVDFEDMKSRGDRTAVFNDVQKLKDLGPDLPSPHMKWLKGEAVASKKKDFDRAVVAARDCLKRHG